MVISLLALSILSFSTKQFKCMPCGERCDNVVYDSPGKCSHCQMSLVDAATITFKNINPADLCKYLSEHPETILLDVRTKDEFEGKGNPNYGVLKNAFNIPIQELEKRTTEIDSLKDREIIVYCSHSRRSPRASYILTQLGFKKITNLDGGMSVLKDNSCKK